jgi:perosamine synthetase
MSNIQAAIGCAQVERIEDLITEKRRVFLTYQKLLRGLPIKMNPEKEGTVNGYWMPSIVVDETIIFDREMLLEAFQAKGIDGRVFFWPLSSLPMFNSQPENTISYDICSRACNLPSYHDLLEEQISRVCNIVRSIIFYRQ